MRTSSEFVLPVRDNFSSAGHVILPNGLGLVVGGDNGHLLWPFLTDGLTSVRIIDPFQATYTLGPGLPSSRWYPSLLTLADGNILIMGGAQVRHHCSLRAGRKTVTPDTWNCQECVSVHCQSSRMATDIHAALSQQQTQQKTLRACKLL